MVILSTRVRAGGIALHDGTARRVLHVRSESGVSLLAKCLRGSTGAAVQVIPAVGEAVAVAPGSVARRLGGVGIAAVAVSFDHLSLKTGNDAIIRVFATATLL